MNKSWKYITAAAALSVLGAANANADSSLIIEAPIVAPAPVYQAPPTVYYQEPVPPGVIVYEDRRWPSAYYHRDHNHYRDWAYWHNNHHDNGHGHGHDRDEHHG